MVKKMKKGNAYVVFDRKCQVKDDNGIGSVDVFVYLARRERKYINVGQCKKCEFEDYQYRRDVLAVKNRCDKVLAALPVLNLELTVDNFNAYYYSEDEKQEMSMEPKNLYKGTDQDTDFLEYYIKFVNEEHISKGTRAHKMCTLRALQRFGQIKTFKDLTAAKIHAFDKWLDDGSRGDVGKYTYHKHLKKVVRHLAMSDMIPSNPYASVPIKRGKSKQRRALTEDEMVIIRNLKLKGKMEKARDLFIFAAYTGLAYCDVMEFDFKLHTDKVGDTYYIDGSRLKTGTEFYTPILPPAMEVLKKWKFKLPRLANQNANDYLHLIEEKIECRKSLTFHIGRHSFATLALTHGYPMEQLMRMLGHKDLKVTQIYAEILPTTIINKTEQVIKELK